MLTGVFVSGVDDQTQVIEPDGLLVLSEGILTERAQRSWGHQIAAAWPTSREVGGGHLGPGPARPRGFVRLLSSVGGDPQHSR